MLSEKELKKMSGRPHIAILDVSDEFVRALYGPNIANDWQPPEDLIKSHERILRNEKIHGHSLVPSRRLDFYKAATCRGIEFTTRDYSVRLSMDYIDRTQYPDSLQYPDRKNGFKSSFFTRSGVGLLEVFNVDNQIERMAGRWIADEKTGEQVFIKDNSLRPNDPKFISDDPIIRYNPGYHLSRFMNKHWPKEIHYPTNP